MARVLAELADELESLDFGHVHLADQLVSEHLPSS